MPNLPSRAYASLRDMRKTFSRLAPVRTVAGQVLAVVGRFLARADNWLISVIFGNDRAAAASPDRAESASDMANHPSNAASSAAGTFGEAVMRMSRARKAVLLGVVVLAVGLTGRAAAQSTPDEPDTRPAAAPATSQPAAPATSKPAPPKSTTKPSIQAPPKGKPAKGNPNGKNISYAGGPAGSRTMTGTKGIALTFDDGPDPATTPQLLKMLAQQHVKATFCLVGKNAARHPELVRQIVAGGHTLCNHTWDHSLKIGKDPEAKIRTDLMRTNNAILRAAPNAKVKYFRAPGGNFTPRLVSVANKLHMTSIYWKLDPRDWDHKKGESSAAHRARLISTIEKHARPGAIILSHDYAQPDTIAAYRTLLPYLRKRFQLVALP
ncbi:hypothetical protein Ade02nite_72900 [Paractinoplanes deccanensis]|uniref:NodB homology domain-containing protein n=3 Tax=Paractinoplanes deccanensis TaxID=113561 RepID=A0ABQ3YFA4_9ACTN|nr:hypothetical protein Ade02nite_72900 [Actinoplanes deccanensis]